MITVTGPKQLSIPAAMGGNDATFGLVLVASSRGLLVENMGDQFAVRGITDTELLTLDVVRMLVAAGADVLGYFVWFEFSDPKDDCPIVDVKTWGEAFGDLHRPRQLGGRWFQPNNMTQSPNDGEPLPASQWINSGVKIVTVAEVRALEAELSPMKRQS